VKLVNLTPVEDDRNKPVQVHVAVTLAGEQMPVLSTAPTVGSAEPLGAMAVKANAAASLFGRGDDDDALLPKPKKAAPADEPRKTSVSELRAKWQRTASSGGVSASGEGDPSPLDSVQSNTAATAPAVSPASSGPAQLPAGWIEQLDPATGHPFYANTNTGATQWERPC
jgi:hypothetical protein